MKTQESIQAWLVTTVAEHLGMNPLDIDIHEPFATYGLESVEMVGLSGDLEDWLGRELSPTLLYDYPTIELLARHLAGDTALPSGVAAQVPYQKGVTGDAVAIIGVGCRFPGGVDSPEAFWHFLKQGKDAISEIPPERWDRDAYYSPDRDAPGKMYTRHGAFLDDISAFDAAFFGISPREALRMDPQQRLLLEVAWEALERAGLAPAALDGSQTGVFIGLMNTLEYAQLQVSQGDSSYLDDPYFGIGSSSSITAGRLAYLLNLHGPALTIDTACSSSLVSLHLACQSLQNRECQLALVGGVNAILLPESLVNACKMGMLSVDGRCKTFDASADGFVLGEGCGVVVLKRLAEALTDGDHILAIIRGSAVNQDGRSNGLTAPNRLAQEAVIRQALANAGVDPRQISYVEAHGSGTALGDPIEIEALVNVLGAERTGDMPLRIGAVKTNIGHLAGAAGIAGLIKTMLALQHQEIPPHLNVHTLNPHISFKECPVEIPSALLPWRVERQPRIAGVSSFGWSGTNAHVIVEEAPAQPSRNPSRTYHLLPLSARSEQALEAASANLLRYLKEHPASNLADIAYTLQTGRSEFTHRRMLVCLDIDDAIRILQTHDPHYLLTGTATIAQNQAALLFPGLAGELEQQEASFRKAVGDYALEQISGQLSLAQMAGKLWLVGAPIDWKGFYTEEQRQKLPLPTYPFERQRYWIGPQKHAQPARHGKKPDIADWFYQRQWKEAPLPEEQLEASAPAPWLIFEDALGLGRQVAAQLAQDGHAVIRVQIGEQFAHPGEDVFCLRPDVKEDYIALCKHLALSHQMPRIVLHCWNVTGQEAGTGDAASFNATQKTGFYSLLALAQALGTQILDEPVRLMVVANYLYAATQQDMLHPEKATIVGACTVIPQENSDILCRSIDVGTAIDEQVANQLRRECMVSVPDLHVAYREQKRYVQQYQPVRLEPTAPVLRQQGVYLITGGLGEVGLMLAAHLAETVQARLALVGRTGFPPREEWKNWLEQHGEEDSISKRIHHLQAMEAVGGEVLILQADIADATRMQEVIDQTLQQFGALHGVIHAAGITTPSTFKAVEAIGRAECETHFRPKVHGLYALSNALAGQHLDFCILFSSISVVLGGLGFIAYAAANSFMDAFVQRYHQRTDAPWFSVNWDTWRTALDAAAIRGTVAEYAMEPFEGIEAFARLLSVRGIPTIVNSTGDLHQRIRQWVHLESLDATKRIAASASEVSSPTESVSAHKTYTDAITAIWQQALGVEKVGLDDNFFDLGGNSLIGLQVLAQLKKAFHVQIPAVVLFEAPTVNALVRYLLPATEQTDAHSQAQMLEERRLKARQVARNQGIAIVGMTGRFPGASNLEQFWQNLQQGVESISFFTPEELEQAGVDPLLLQNPDYVRARPILTGIDQFDAAFFGYSPHEARFTDPQHRLFLECCWDALELAGYDPSTYDGLVGVFGGTNLSTYLLGLASDPALLRSIDDYQIVIGNDKDSLTTTVSYKLNLRGPSFAVQTFCSTSLVAVHLACQSLLAGECDMALAGGVSIRVPSKAGHLYQEGGMESPDGHCRTFDAEARGSIFGDGAGVVVLKRLDEALADGDYIHAIIKGSAINNDGSLKVSYTAPSVMGQAEVVSAALTSAGVSPETMSYVEAHGTATELGDPIEVAALTKAFQAQTARTRYCAIGSVKTNVGHLDRAAGVTGLIKTVLAMQHEELPPSLHFQTPNPEIDFAHSPFYVNATLAPWIRGPAPRRAGINSLGMGGTNAHVVLEEAPPRPAPEVSRPWHLLVLSARSETALGAIAQHLCAYLEQHDDSALADIAYTLQVGRKRFEHRQMLCCRTREEAIQLLRDLEPSRVASHREQRTDRSVTFLFPGLGEQYAGMTQELYRQEAVFRQTVDRCCTILKTQLGIDLRELLYPEEYEANGQQANGTSALAPAPSPAHVANGHAAPQAGIDLRAMLNRTNGTGHHPRHDSTSAERLKQTALAQPAVFVLEYALAQLLMQWGIRPQAMLGYSLGEYVAACLSGVLSLEDALTLVARRAALIQQTQEGAMIAVALSEDAVQPYLSQQVSLAVINAPGTCVLAGLFKAIEQVEIRLTAQGVAYRRIETTHAFHSALLEPVQAALTELVRGMALQKPQILYISNVTGTWITPEEATDPAYWARHMCQTVRFAEGVGHLLEETDHILLEVGPGQSLGSFVKQHSLSGRERTVVSSLPARFDKQSEQAAIIHMLGKLWLAGVSIDWMGYHVGTRRYRLPLPTYPFERQSYWLEPSTRPLMKGSVAASSSASVPALSNETERKADIADWFYVPLWKQSPPRTPIDLTAQHCWLVLLDECGVGAKLVSELRRNDQKVVSVSIGKTFTIQGNESYSVNPALRADYVALLQVLRSQKMTPDRIVHLWTITPQNVAANSYDVLDEILEKGFYSLLALAQAIGDTGFDACRISVISNQVQDVSGGETLQPEKSTLIGPCRVISQEYPGIACQSIDVTLSEPGSYQEALLLQQLIAEMSANGTDGVVALRGHHRWMQTFEPVQLLPEAPAEIRPLRQNGVYLITGGPGGIGLAMAEYLAHTVAARLILIGRTAFPPRHEWPHLLATRGAEERIVEQIRKIQALEAAGAEVLVLQADVAEEAQMKAAVQQAISVFGTIHGVLHAAGVPGAGLIQLKTPEIASSVLAPKVKGTLILERVLQHIPLDFMVLFSSITSTTGGPGQVDYCAANAFLDAYAHSRFLQQKNVLAIDWSEWQWNAWEAGLAGLNEEVQRFFKESRRAFGITFVEGAEALSRMLARRLPHVVVSTQDFNAIIAMNKTLTATLLQRAQHRQQVQEAHARPSLANSYVAPRNEIERRIAAYWEQLLGIDRVGIHDNFFELGGNSLIGIDLIGRMRKELDVEFLPAYILYEAPSVSAMAHYLEQSATTPVSVNTWQERSEKRRENLKLRMRETRKVRQESQ